MCFHLKPNVKYNIVVYIGTEAGNEHYSHIVIDILKGTCEIIMDPHTDFEWIKLANSIDIKYLPLLIQLLMIKLNFRKHDFNEFSV